MITFLIVLVLLLFSGILVKGLLKILRAFIMIGIIFFLVVVIGATIGVATDKADHLVNSTTTIQEEKEDCNSDAIISELQELSQKLNETK